MDVTVLLADFAQVADGKLTIVGAGWMFRAQQPSPCAIGLLVDATRGDVGRPHDLTVELVDADGNGAPGPDGTPLAWTVQLDAGWPAGHPAGMPITMPIAFNVGPVGLPAGTYEWRVTIDGELRDTWRRSFVVR